jgi:peptide/nickel transport system substrate-binding protein
MIKVRAGLLCLFGFMYLSMGCRGQAGEARESNLSYAEVANTGVNDQIVFGMSWEPVGFFPIRAIDSGSYYAQTLVYEGLVKYDPQIKIVPALAEEYTISDGGLRYEFRLRKNLRFSDGTTISAKDVEASFKVATGADSPFKGDYRDISSFEAIGEDRFVIHLSSPNGALLSRLVELRILPARLIALPDRGRSILSRKPISSGPFCLTKWESGLELSFAPNQYYWGEKPRVERLIWRVIPDKTLLALCLSRGEIEVAQIDPQSWKGISQQPGLVVDRFAGSRTMYLGFNLAKEPFKRLPLREAICRGINRQAIVDKLLEGYGRIPATDVPSGSWVFDDKVKSFPYDHEAASKQLGEFERTTPFKQVNFRILAVRDHQDVAAAVSCDLERIGIKNEVQIVEFSTLRRQYLQPGKFDLAIWSRSSGPDPECGIVWGSKGPLNFCRFVNPKVDELLRRGRREMDKRQRAAVYGEVQTILAKDLPWVFLYQPDLLLAHSTDCHNIRLGNQTASGLPWDNPLFNAAYWERSKNVSTQLR